jgi:hypothetical protein
MQNFWSLTAIASLLATGGCAPHLAQPRIVPRSRALTGWSIHSISPCYLGGSAGRPGTSAICAQHLQIPRLYKLIEAVDAAKKAAITAAATEAAAAGACVPPRL